MSLFPKQLGIWSLLAICIGLSAEDGVSFSLIYQGSGGRTPADSEGAAKHIAEMKKSSQSRAFRGSIYGAIKSKGQRLGGASISISGFVYDFSTNGVYQVRAEKKLMVFS